MKQKINLLYLNLSKNIVLTECQLLQGATASRCSSSTESPHQRWSRSPSWNILWEAPSPSRPGCATLHLQTTINIERNTCSAWPMIIVSSYYYIPCQIYAGFFHAKSITFERSRPFDLPKSFPVVLFYALNNFFENLFNFFYHYKSETSG